MTEKLILNYERVIIESKNPDNGYCYINVHNEVDDRYITLDGNMSEKQAEGELPLCLCSNEEIDEFAKKLKQILNK